MIYEDASAKVPRLSMNSNLQTAEGRSRMEPTVQSMMSPQAAKYATINGRVDARHESFRFNQLAPPSLSTFNQHYPATPDNGTAIAFNKLGRNFRGAKVQTGNRADAATPPDELSSPAHFGIQQETIEDAINLALGRSALQDPAYPRSSHGVGQARVGVAAPIGRTKSVAVENISVPPIQSQNYTGQMKPRNAAGHAGLYRVLTPNLDSISDVPEQK